MGKKWTFFLRSYIEEILFAFNVFNNKILIKTNPIIQPWKIVIPGMLFGNKRVISNPLKYSLSSGILFGLNSEMIDKTNAILVTTAPEINANFFMA